MRDLDEHGYSMFVIKIYENKNSESNYTPLRV